MTLLEDWLAAREHTTIRRAWEALPTKRVPYPGYRKLTLHGAAQLAGAMHGTRADWLVDSSLHGAPIYDVQRISEGAFLDHIWAITEANQESLRIHERDGVQLISMSSGTITGRPEGGGVTAVRIFDRERAVVVPIETYGAWEVAVLGEVDLAPLDLLQAGPIFSMPVAHDPASARALVAQLLSEVDAHFDVSTSWPEGPLITTGLYVPDIAWATTYVDGPRAVTIASDRLRNYILAEAHGLPWGHRFGLSLEPGGRGDTILRFPAADLDRIEARIGTLGTLG